MAYDAHWRTKLIVNGTGGVMTAVVMCVFAITKFRDGAWMVVLLIPLLVLAYSGVHRHYQRVAAQLSLGDLPVHPHASRVRTLLLVGDVHAGTLRLINFAESLGADWQAVHVAIDPEKAEVVHAKWRKRVGLGELLVLPSPYRSVSEPLRDYIRELQEAEPNAFIHLLVGQLSLPDYGEQLLHRNTNLLIDLVLRDMDRVVVTSVPYQIDQRERYAARLAAELD